MVVTAHLSREQIVQRLRGLEPQLRGRGVTSLAIFGSRARGDARPDSDLDVLVDINPGAEFSLLDLVGVQHTIRDATGFETQATIRNDIETDLAGRISDDLVKVF